jgi:organic radical activating enzyme
MMVKQIISAKLHGNRKIFKKDGENFLRISEFFWDTIQGEGIYIGQPAAFLRLQGCTLNCSYCDTEKVWKIGSPYTFKELFELIDHSLGFITALKAGQHLIISGGSPLLQQERLANFLVEFDSRYKFTPFIEIENECIIKPIHWLSISNIIHCWNNSPKLASSGIPLEKRYNADIIRYMASLQNSWFKFVMFYKDDEDWNEIEELYLKPKLIRKDQIILMPGGATKKEIKRNRAEVIETAIKHNVRYISREHIILWGNKVGR